MADDCGLSELFDSSFAIVKRLDGDYTLETNSTEFQSLVLKGISQLEKATELINSVQLFSSNETLEEVTSRDIKLLLVPALLAYLSEKCNRHERAVSIESAQVYYKDFLKRIKEYGVINERCVSEDEHEDEDVQRQPDLDDIVRRRNDKIARFRKAKEMEQQLEDLQNHQDDDEKMRKYHILLLKTWSGKAMEELESLKMESSLLKRAGPSTEAKNPKSKPRAPFKPFIITRNEIEKKVYGLGYPSVPTMTVDEFVDQKEKDGTWAFSNKNIYSNSLQQWAEDPDRKGREDEEIEAQKELLVEKEDDEAIQKARQWDEFRDEVKRGSGNRMNMS